MEDTTHDVSRIIFAWIKRDGDQDFLAIPDR